MVKVINLIAPPGTGKSTISSELFAKMKWDGYDVELVSEFAKDLVWEQRHETFKNQLYIFAKQQHRLFRLSQRVEYIVTDCPLILSEFYNQEYGNKSQVFCDLVLEEVRKFDNINYLLKRTKPYNPKGRNQTQEEADGFYEKMKGLLLKKGLNFTELDAIQDVTSGIILDRLKEKTNEE